MGLFLSVLLESLKDHLLITLSVGIGCLLAARRLDRRSHFKIRVSISFFAAFAWMVLTRYYLNFHPETPFRVRFIRYIVLFLLFGFSVSFWSRADFCQALFSIAISYSLQNMCERLIEIPRHTLPHFPFLLDRLCLMLLLGVSLIAYARIVKGGAGQRSLFDFSRRNRRMMLFIGIGVVAVSMWIDIMLREYSDIENIALLNVHNLMSAIFSFLTILVCVSRLRESESERRADMTAQLLYNERERYERDRQIHDAINIKCHDIRHQLAAMGEEGYRQELKKIGKLIDIYDAVPRTHNVALDVILSGKMLACTNQGITLTCLADGRRLSFMEDCDIYALFGNILDNAIEAVLAISDPEHRIISLTVDTTGNLLRISCENFYVNKVTFREGLPETSKQDKDYHGFGTRSIRFLTEKYGGDLKIGVEDGVFRLSIMLPIPASNGSPEAAADAQDGQSKTGAPQNKW